MSLTPKKVFELETVNLICHLTGFGSHEKNFRICETFILSNLFYHKFLDPDEKKVRDTITGIIEKLEIQRHSEKARKLERAVDRYWNDPAFEKNLTEQYDIKIRLLSLLLHLSNSVGSSLLPRDSEEDSTPEEEVVEEKKEVDWRALLAEGESIFHYSSESELSEWSDSSSKGEEIKAVKPEEEEEEEFEPSPFIAASNPRSLSLAEEIKCAKLWLEDNIQGEEFDNFDKNCLIEKYDSRLIEAGIPRRPLRILSEYQILREVLWMLRSPIEDSLIFSWDSGEFRVDPSVTLSTLANLSLVESLNKFTGILNRIKDLQDFIKRVSEVPSPFTYEAYSGSLSMILHRFSKRLLEVEKIVAAQNETFTLLKLSNELGDWFKILTSVNAVHKRAISDHKGNRPNWYKAVKLICVLSDTIALCYKEEESDVFIELFLRSLNPYFRIIDLWLAEGRLEDWRDEFIFIQDRTKEVKVENFWSTAFSERPFREELAKDSLKIPDFLERCLEKVIVCGKSIEILTILDEESGFKRSVEYTTFTTPIFQDLVNGIKSELDSTETKNKKCQTDSNDEDVSCFDDFEIDPYLVLAFKNLKTERTHEETDEENNEDFILAGYRFDPIKPFHLILQSVLSPIIDSHYESGCSLLLKLFKETLQLEEHLSSVRRVFLMEAGDLLAEFYTDMFFRSQNEEIDDNNDDDEGFDSASLTLFLQECISRRHSREEAERFYVSLKEDQKDFLESLSLSYEVQWPLSIILSRETLSIYDDVFRFLLKVKRAIWALTTIRAKELVEDEGMSCSNSSSSLDSDDDERSENKIHRILLLRSWLFHFVGNVHSYFMTRVLHSTEVELKNNIANCKDLDGIIKVHSDYIMGIFDRCFLHSSTRILRSAVLKVLDICMTLQKMCRSGNVKKISMSSIEKLEENYSRSHQFLASTLKTMTQKRNVPHLDGLAAALIYSYPQKI